MVKRILLVAAIILISFSFGWYLNVILRRENKTQSIPFPIIPKPLEKYSIENLASYNFPEGIIRIERELNDDPSYTSYLFTFEFNPSLDPKVTKKTTGQINIPKTSLDNEKFPLVVMFRGYIDQTIYQTGIGTKKAAEYFAENGFITIAPDFLGYGESDPEAVNIFETRFQTYVTALSLLNSVGSLEPWDGENIFIWGHSNGGQVALTVLEITQGTYPTVLWAPVSKPFPYSVLYYTDESEDLGKLIRRELAKFEELYDPNSYSIHSYYDRIKAPIQLHQGTADDAVPVSWSNNLESIFKEKDIEIEYFKYQGADHNLNPRPSWEIATSRSLKFFQDRLKTKKVDNAP